MHFCETICNTADKGWDWFSLNFKFLNATVNAIMQLLALHDRYDWTNPYDMSSEDPRSGWKDQKHGFWSFPKISHENAHWVSF